MTISAKHIKMWAHICALTWIPVKGAMSMKVLRNDIDQYNTELPLSIEVLERR